MRLRRTKKLRS